MNNKFVEKFRKNYMFLEKYGFTFDVDPCNPNRPCYKNEYGEIIEYYKNNGSGVFSKEIFVQINGWKKEINLKEEYKKYIGKSTLFKPQHILFKELFEYLCFRNNKFYDLPITFNKRESLNTDYVKTYDQQDTKYNFNIIKPANSYSKFTLLLVIMAITTIFLQLLISDINTYITNYQTYITIYYIISICTPIYAICISILYFCDKQILLGIYNFIFIIPIYFIEYYKYPKVGEYFLIIYLLVGLLLLAGKIIIGNVKKRKQNIAFLTIFLYYPLLRLILRALYVSTTIHANLNIPNWLLIVFLVIAIVCLIICLIFGKGKLKKKDYIWSSVGSFALGFFIPFLLVHTGFLYTNYLFDTSNGVIEERMIVDSEIEVRTGRYSRTHYYLIVVIDNADEKIEVSKIMYYHMKNKSRLLLKKHNGFYDKEYYIIIDEEIEKIKHK